MDLLDFTETENCWHFKLGPAKEGEIWMEILLEFKAAIPARQRIYSPKRDHRWGCLKTPKNRAALIDIFDNAKHCIETLELSRKLPGFE